MNPSKFKLSWQLLVPVFLIIFFLSLLSFKMRRAPWYEQLAWNVASPVVSIFSWFGGGMGDTWHHYVALTHTVEENDRLKKTLAALEQKVTTFDELQNENGRFHQLLELKQAQWQPTVAARVIAYDPRSEFKSIRIDKGSKDGVEPDMPVIGLNGLVGKVGPVFSDAALVLLIIDPASTVDVLVERSRVRGLLSGAAKNTELRPGYFLTRMEYLKRASDIQVGDKIITSGLDRLFPKGVLVGTVEQVQSNRYAIFVEAEVVPSIDFTQLEEVLVLKKP